VAAPPGLFSGRVTDMRRLRIVSEFLHLLAVRAREDRLFQVAGSLTFTTLLALVPMITIALTVFSAFPVFAEFSQAIRNFVLSNLVPTSAGKVIAVYTEQFAQNAGRLTALGIVILGVAAFMMMLTIDHAFNTIWRVRRPRPLVGRLLIYWGAVTIGPLLVGVSLYVTSWVLSRSMGMMGESRSGTLLYSAVPAVLTSLAFSFLYRTVPNRPVAVRDALAGGILAGLLFEAAKAAFGAYIRQVPMYKLVYGAFASFPIFLIWIYISWMIILIGAVVAAALPYLHGGGVRMRKAPGSDFMDALRLLRLLYQAHMAGRVMKVMELRDGVRLPLEKCEELLEQLAAAGWAARAQGDGWVLARDVSEIRLADLYREFVFHAEPVHREHGKASLEGGVATLTAALHDDLSMTLKSVFQRDDGKRKAGTS
jgi:membrane protein